MANFICLGVYYYCFFPHQVNIIPVIAKADTVSRSELSLFKARVSGMTWCYMTGKGGHVGPGS